MARSTRNIQQQLHERTNEIFDSGLQEKTGDVEVDVERALSAASHWRKFVRKGDDLLIVVQEIKGAVQKAIKKRKIDWRYIRRHLSEMKSNTKKLRKVSNTMYGDFAEGREAFYDLIQDWGLSKSSGHSKKIKSKSLKSQDTIQILKAILKQSDRLAKAMREMLELGARAQKLLRKAAKAKMISEGEKKKLISTCFRFRNKISESLYGRVGGLQRRAREFLKRARKHAKHEHHYEREHELLNEVLTSNGVLCQDSPVPVWIADSEIVSHFPEAFLE